MDYQQPLSPEPVPPMPPKKNNTAIIITIIICAALIIITGLITIMVLKTGDNSGRKDSGSSTVSQPENPTEALTTEPTEEPTAASTEAPTEAPTEKPTEAPLYMPDLLYYSADYAQEKAEEAGLKAHMSYIETDKHTAGKVYDQSPDPGEEVKKGDLIFLYIAKPKATSAPAPTAAPWPPHGALLYVTADDYVSLREMPGTKYPEIVRIPHGEMLGYLNSRSGDWLYVGYGDDNGYHKGYVYAKYVTTDRSAVYH